MEKFGLISPFSYGLSHLTQRDLYGVIVYWLLLFLYSGAFLFLFLERSVDFIKFYGGIGFIVAGAHGLCGSLLSTKANVFVLSLGLIGVGLFLFFSL